MARSWSVVVWVLLSATAWASGPAPQPTVGLQFKPLIEYLEEVVSDPILEGALIGARVDNLKTGQTLFAHQPDQLINPDTTG